MEFVGDCPIAAHNANFDASLLKAELRRLGLSWRAPVLDALTFLHWKLYPDMKSHKLGTVCQGVGREPQDGAPRRAWCDGDGPLSGKNVPRRLGKREPDTLQDLNDELKGGAVGESFHLVLLVEAQKGMENLDPAGIHRAPGLFPPPPPHAPDASIQKYREGLIVGSACEAGELFRAVLAGEPWDKLKKIARFYDYLEIQPIGNNAFLVREGRVPGRRGLAGR